MVIFVLLIVVVALFLAHQAAKGQVAKLRQNPDPFPLAQLDEPMPGESAMVERADGTLIHTRSVGDGSAGTVILSHGYGYEMQEWNVIAGMLLDLDYRLIALDLRGHGKSTIGRDGMTSKAMAADYKAVIEHYDVKDAILVGHSTGVFLTTVFMLDYPDVVAKHLKAAVLMAGLCGNALEGSPQNRVQIPLIKYGIIESVARSNVYGWLFGASLCGEKPSPAIIQAFLKTFLKQPHKKLFGILNALAVENHYPRLHEIKIPCVIICGEADKTTPRWHSETMGRNIPDARNVWVPHQGHLLNWEAPDVLVEAVQSLS
ncbi:MAG: alpha/beta hydrolase [Aggregatilineales bacterium]